jgi:hypothetical protein
MLQDEEKLAAGELWRDHDLAFATMVGAELDAANVRRHFPGICKVLASGRTGLTGSCGIASSASSASGVPVEEIACLAGHFSSRATESFTEGTPPGTGQGRRGNGPDLPMNSGRSSRADSIDWRRRRLRHVGAPPVDSDNQSALAKQHRSPPHSVVCHPEIAG